MRILLVGSFYEPESSGIAIYNAAYARHLVSRGHDVTVLTVLPNYPHGKIYEGYRRRLGCYEIIDGVRVNRRWVYTSRSQSLLVRALHEMSFLLNGAAAAFAARPDVIIGVVPALSGGVLSRLLSMRYRIPYGLVFQDLVAAGAAQSGARGGKLVARALQYPERWILGKASAVGILGGGYRDLFTSLDVPPEKLIEIPNWTHIGSSTMSRSAVRARLGIPQDAFVCLHSGNMGLKQGLYNILDCALIAGRHHGNMLFLLVGDGNQRDALEKQAIEMRLENVRFLDFQPKEIFPSMLAAADVLLLNQLASVTDMSVPSKLTSYLASGTPTVAAVARDSEAGLAVQASGGGIVVEPEQPDELLGGIESLSKDESLREELGKKGQTFAAENLTAETSLRGLDHLVDTVSRGRLATKP